MSNPDQNLDMVRSSNQLSTSRPGSGGATTQRPTSNPATSAATSQRSNSNPRTGDAATPAGFMDVAVVTPFPQESSNSTTGSASQPSQPSQSSQPSQPNAARSEALSPQLLSKISEHMDALSQGVDKFESLAQQYGSKIQLQKSNEVTSLSEISQECDAIQNLIRSFWEGKKVLDAEQRNNIKKLQSDLQQLRVSSDRSSMDATALDEFTSVEQRISSGLDFYAANMSEAQDVFTSLDARIAACTAKTEKLTVASQQLSFSRFLALHTDISLLRLSAQADHRAIAGLKNEMKTIRSKINNSFEQNAQLLKESMRMQLPAAVANEFARADENRGFSRLQNAQMREAVRAMFEEVQASAASSASNASSASTTPSTASGTRFSTTSSAAPTTATTTAPSTLFSTAPTTATTTAPTTAPTTRLSSTPRLSSLLDPPDLSFITTEWEQSILGNSAGVKCLADQFSSLAIPKERTEFTGVMPTGLWPVMEDVKGQMEFYKIASLVNLKQSDYAHLLSHQVQNQFILAGEALLANLSESSREQLRTLREYRNYDGKFLPSIVHNLNELVDKCDPQLALQVLAKPLVRKVDEPFDDFVARLWDTHRRIIPKKLWKDSYRTSVLQYIIVGLQPHYPKAVKTLHMHIIKYAPESFPDIDRVAAWCRSFAFTCINSPE